jgi:hypothetical protein
MGTRNLTVVIDKNNETKVAQYGQWDGYPDGQGVTILSFISENANLKKLSDNLSKVRFLDRNGVDKSFMEEYSKNAPEWSNEPDNRTEEQKRWFKTYMSRDIAGEILEVIANSGDDEIKLENSISFAADSLFCEYAYVVDLSKNTFEVYSGYNKKELTETERFHDLKPEKDSEYTPVCLAKTYPLNELPSQDVFIKDFEEEDED